MCGRVLDGKPEEGAVVVECMMALDDDILEWILLLQLVLA